jgi:tripartite-type tricarboxylate transporter receptor subunit TctC
MKNIEFAAGCVLAFLASTARTQTYPEKPVTLIAPFSAGGSVDLVARAVAQQMSELWKQPVIVSNRPGASGNIGVEAVVRAPPDGYTLLLGTTALSSSPALFPKLPFDPVRDLTPVSLVVTMPNVLVVHPSLPAQSVKELLALAKANPNTLNSGSAGVGSSNHLALVLFNMLSNAGINHVPYKGAAPAVADVMGGHVSMTFAPIAAVVTMIKAKRLRALAVTAAARTAIFPEMPTIAEGGVAGYDAAGWNGLFLPRAASRELVMRVQGTLKDSLSSPRLKDVMVNAGADAVGNMPEAFAKFFQNEIAKWSKVVKTAGIKGE